MQLKYLASFDWHTGIPDGETIHECLIPVVDLKESPMEEILKQALFTYNQTQVPYGSSPPFQFEEIKKFDSFGETFHLVVTSNEYARPLDVSVKIKPVLVEQGFVFDVPCIGKDFMSI